MVVELALAGSNGGVNKPLLRTRLTLSSLDERIVPDGSGPTPPTSPPPQQGEQPSTLAAGQTQFHGHVGDSDIYVTNDSASGLWLTLVNTVTNVATAVPLDLNLVQGQVPAEATDSYQPDTSKWTLVWEQGTGTWTALPPGTANLPAGRGMLDGTTNVVYTGTVADYAAPPRPSGGVTLGGFQIIPIPNGFILVDPLGNQFGVNRPGTPRRDGYPRDILFEIIPLGGPILRKTIPMPPDPTPEPPLAKPKKPPLAFNDSGPVVGVIEDVVVAT